MFSFDFDISRFCKNRQLALGGLNNILPKEHLIQKLSDEY